MANEDKLKKISERLFKENICTVVLDDDSLHIIEHYMLMKDQAGDLMRRISSVNENYRQMCFEAEEISQKADIAKCKIASLLRSLTDDWRKCGILRDFVFSYSETECEYIRESYSKQTEGINFQLRIISGVLVNLTETAVQLRACSASFAKIHRETKLALYAALLDKSPERILECREMMMEAHLLSSEAEKDSSKISQISNACMKTVLVINKMMTDVLYSVKIKGTCKQHKDIFSPANVSGIISSAIIKLENTDLKFICNL